MTVTLSKSPDVETLMTASSRCARTRLSTALTGLCSVEQMSSSKTVNTFNDDVLGAAACFPTKRPSHYIHLDRHQRKSRD